MGLQMSATRALMLVLLVYHFDMFMWQIWGSSHFEIGIDIHLAFICECTF